MWLLRTGIHQILVRIANREDPDQIASSDQGLRYLSRPFWQATRVKILEHLHVQYLPESIHTDWYQIIHILWCDGLLPQVFPKSETYIDDR